MPQPSLLPCPHCGAPARRHRYHGDPTRFYFHCGRTEGICPGQQTFPPCEEAEAITAWNTRTIWQPITTAPRDGTVIDLWMPKTKRRCVNCYWGRPSHSCGENEGHCDACPDHDGWVDGEDFLMGYTDEEPSHWMPRPMSPEMAA